MYKLYDMLTIKKLVENEDEQKVVDKLEEVVTDNCYFMIIKQNKGGSEIFRGIRNKRDFNGYKQDFEYRKIAEAPCVKLKKYIVENDIANKK